MTQLNNETYLLLLLLNISAEPLFLQKNREVKSPLIDLYKHHPLISKIENLLQEKSANIHLKGLSGSVISLIVASLGKISPHILIVQDKETAAYLYNDIIQLTSDESVFFLPSSYKRSPEFGQPDSSNEILRTEALRNLQKASLFKFFVSYPEALMERVPDVKEIGRAHV